MHWDIQHKKTGLVYYSTLVDGVEPEEPWCDNWKEALQLDVLPINIKPKYR